MKEITITKEQYEKRMQDTIQWVARRVKDLGIDDMNKVMSIGLGASMSLSRMQAVLFEEEGSEDSGNQNV